ncbi:MULTISPECIES: class II aldolase/adducin family protein [unclassified Streptomyces]|uniref:class II aldolase/adducin family protein n=1 Tax=unclassified Streptomyces TaxID=2593676 RepID=UPI0007ED55E8|nr:MULTISPECIES: class II aldolase/adducin family protein [unclassified Streptomyces]MCP3766185.1 class II aldolase/adducin family protein [Streptomyces sp. MAR25Y5]OBQ47576.1 fuculose phosphate aldolase [Streptomyces sp. H-KF8]
MSERHGERRDERRAAEDEARAADRPQRGGERREPGGGRRERRDGAVSGEEAHAWAALVGAARRTVSDGFVVGTSGNVSVRVGETVLVTPSGVPYDRLTPDDVTGVDLAGRQVLGALAPTSELPLHLAVYRTTGARAVVHTHAVHATAVSTLVDELPPIHYMAAALGGPVRVAPYATYGTDELAENMLRALDGRTGCLLQNHGTVTHGTTLDQAYDRTAQLEWMCRLWLTASSLPGRSPNLLSAGHLTEAADRLRSYGQHG